MKYIPQKWLDLADSIAETYARDFHEHPEYRGSNFTANSLCGVAANSVGINMTPNAYRRYGKHIEKRARKEVVRRFNELETT